jgi:hypothetical protein
MIPEWFKHQSRGTTESGATFPFWFRNKLPFIVIFVSTNSMMSYDRHDLGKSYFVVSFDLCINDCKKDFGVKMPLSHTYLFNLRMQHRFESGGHISSKRKVLEAFEKNDWIRAEIKFEYRDTFHLYFKEESNADDIRFTDPNSTSQYQPLLKKQRLVDVEELDTEFHL